LIVFVNYVVFESVNISVIHNIEMKKIMRQTIIKISGVNYEIKKQTVHNIVQKLAKSA